jgi:hypothetical protein
MPERTLTCVECGSAMSFGASECPACGVGYRYVKGEPVAELDEAESDADESDAAVPAILGGDDPLEAARRNRAPQTEGLDGSRTAGLLFVIDGALGLARGMYFNFEVPFDFWMAYPVVETVIGLALIWFRRRLLVVALLFVAVMDIRPFVENLWQFRSALTHDIAAYSTFPILLGALDQLHSVPPTLLLVGMPGRGRFVTGILVFLLYQTLVLTMWRWAAAVF